MPTLLLVDDNATLTVFTAHNLEASIPGLEVITAGTCAGAEIVAGKQRIDVVIVDRRLPDGDGLELLRRLGRKQNRFASIVVSADAPAMMRTEASGLGVHHILAKPYEVEELVGCVHQALADVAAEDSEPDLPEGDREMPPDENGFDRHRMINRLSSLLAGLRALGADLRAEADDPEAVRRIADEYIERLVGAVREASDLVRRH